MSRYALGVNSQLRYGIETESYTLEESEPGNFSNLNEFGLLTEDIDVPNPNQHQSVPQATTTGAYVHSPQQLEYEFDVEVRPQDPGDFGILEAVLGDVESGENLGDEFEFDTYSINRPLATATIAHVQTDIDIIQWFGGCKGSLTISAAQGDPLTFSYGVTAAFRDYDPEQSAPAISSAVSTDVQPYHWVHLGEVTYANTLIATVTSIDLSLDNGLEANHHGDAGEELGRDAYSVSEETNAEMLDGQSLEYKVENADLFEEAAENKAEVDIEIPFQRVTDDSDGFVIQDGVIIRLDGSKITDAPIPYTAEGSIDGSVEFNAKDLEIEVREEL